MEVDWYRIVCPLVWCFAARRHGRSDAGMYICNSASEFLYAKTNQRDYACTPPSRDDMHDTVEQIRYTRRSKYSALLFQSGLLSAVVATLGRSPRP